MINLLYETAGRLSPDWIMKSDSSTLPLWYNGWGEKIMFMNLYPIATESAKDLYVILNRMVKENHLVFKYPLLWSRMERVLCPRVHFKLLIFDLKQVYIGSANLTEAVEQFDELWMGIPCKTCKRKKYCSDRIT